MLSLFQCDAVLLMAKYTLLFNLSKWIWPHDKGSHLNENISSLCKQNIVFRPRLLVDDKMFTKICEKIQCRGGFNIKLGVAGFTVIYTTCDTLAWQINFQCGFFLFILCVIFSCENRIYTTVYVWFYLLYKLIFIWRLFNKQIKPKTTF